MSRAPRLSSRQGRTEAGEARVERKSEPYSLHNLLRHSICWPFRQPRTERIFGRLSPFPRWDE